MSLVPHDIESPHLRSVTSITVFGAVSERLVRLQTFEQAVEHFDAIHSFRERGVVITLFDDLLNAPLKCPNPAEEARAICDDLEAAVANAEDRTIDSLRADFHISAHLSYGGKPGTHRPRIENFDGALLRAGYAGEAPVAEGVETVPAKVRDWLSHLSTFEGAHFDIRNPVGKHGLNRVGETGYNYPTLNIYAGR